MTTGERIKGRRLQLGMNAETLAALCGISPATIYRYEKGDIENMRIDKLEPISEALHTTQAYLLGIVDDPTDYDSGTLLAEIPSSYIELCNGDTKKAYQVWKAAEEDASIFQLKGVSPAPHTNLKPELGEIACGEPILAEQNIERYINVPDWVECDFILRCKGDSMIGARIYDGDEVCIRQQPDVESGEIAAVLIDDEATLKRVKKYEDHIVLEPENPNYRPLSFWDADMGRVRILGKATYFISKVI